MQQLIDEYPELMILILKYAHYIPPTGNLKRSPTHSYDIYKQWLVRTHTLAHINKQVGRLMCKEFDLSSYPLLRAYCREWQLSNQLFLADRHPRRENATK